MYSYLMVHVAILLFDSATVKEIQKRNTLQIKNWCPQTCGLCPESVSQCRDRNALHCKSLYRSCHDPEYREFLKYYCPKTCDSCESVSTFLRKLLLSCKFPWWMTFLGWRGNKNTVKIKDSVHSCQKRLYFVTNIYLSFLAQSTNLAVKH